MAKTKISELDAAAANNTDINSVDVSEGCAPSGINNAIREMGAMLKRMDNGTDHLTNPNITGDLDVDNININGNTISSTDTNGNITLAPNGTGVVALSSTDLTFGDNDKAVFGADSDMSLFHNGNNAFLDNDTGTLFIQTDALSVKNAAGTESVMLGAADGAVTIYHDNSAKLATTATGIDVTGTALAHTVEIGNGVAGGTSEILFSDSVSGRAKILYDHSASPNEEMGFEIAGTRYMTIENGGNIGIGTDAPAHNVEIVATNDGSVNDSLQIRNNATSTGTGSRIRFINSTDKNSDANGASIASVRNGNDNDLVFETENSEAMRIDHNGLVGIGESSPAQKVHISDTGTTSSVRLRLQNSEGFGEISTDSNAIQLRNAGGIVFEGVDNNYTAIRDGDNAEVMRIAGGEVLIDKTASDNTTQGFRFRTTGEASFVKNSSGGAPLYVNRQGNDGTAINFGRANSQVGTITVNASGTSYNETSDHRLKENVVALTGAIDRVKALAPKRFNFIVDADTTVDGFIAHEAQTVVPEAVTGTHNEVDDGGNAVYQGIDKSKLVPLLTGALQEAIAKIEDLETRLAALEGA